MRLCGRGVLRLCHGMVTVMATLAALLAVVLTVASNRPVPLGTWVGDLGESQLAAQLARLGLRAEMGAFEISLARGLIPVLTAHDLQVYEIGSDTPLAALDFAEVAVQRNSLALGRVRPTALSLDGLRLVVVRRAETVTLAVGQAELLEALTSPGDLLAGIDGLLSRPLLSYLDRVAVSGMNVALEDRPNGVVWRSRSGEINLRRTDRDVALDVTLAELGDVGSSGVIRVQVEGNAVTRTGGLRIAGLGMNPAAFRPSDGAPVPLEGFGDADAPVSVTLSAEIAPGGALGVLAGTLSVGAGYWTPPGGRMVTFDSAQAAVTLSGDQRHLRMTELSLDSDLLRLAGTLQVLADEDARGALTGGTLQLSLRDVWLAPDLGPPEPLDLRFVEAVFGYDRATGRVTLAPSHLVTDAQAFEVSGFVAPPAVSPPTDGPLPLMPVEEPGSERSLPPERVERIAARPAEVAPRPRRMRPLPPGWQAGVDLKANALALDALLPLWPDTVAPPTRMWVSNNLLAAQAEAVRLSMRVAPEGPVETGLSLRFHDARVQVDPRLPPVEEAVGLLSLQERMLGVHVADGYMAVPEGPPVRLRSAVVSKADTADRDLPMEVVISAAAPASSALEVLGLPLFAPRDGRPRPPMPIAPKDLQGEVEIDLALSLPLGPNRAPGALRYRADGIVRDVANATLVTGREVRSPALRLAVSPELVEVAGPVTLDGLPADIVWRRALGPDALRESRLEFTAPLTQAALANFGVPLTPQMADGAGRVTGTVRLAPGAPAALSLTGDLQGLRLRVPALGVSKPAAAAGRVALSGQLGPGGGFERLEVATQGLDLAGAITMAPGGGLQSLRFSRARLGGWFDGSAELRRTGAGAATLEVTGGAVDLRGLPRGGSGGGGRGGVGSLTVALDRVTVSDTLALTDARGALDLAGGVRGDIQGRVNGGALVDVALSPGAAGLTIEILSQDAGAVLRDANIYPKAHGGALDLRLDATGAPGTYRGRARINDTVVRNAPMAANLLSAISLVGLAEQAGSGGLAFGRVEARFVATPDRLVITEGYARGPSLGLSIDGTLDTQARQLNLAGTISPFYFLNRVGEGMTRRGEGLFGITFRLTGPFDAPQMRANPLSLLTPGMFREIFRRAPPQIREPGESQ